MCMRMRARARTHTCMYVPVEIKFYAIAHVMLELCSLD